MSMCSVLLLLHIQVMMLHTTVHHNASVREDPIDRTFAHSCTLEHSDAAMFYDVTLVQFYIASLLYCFINKYRIAIVLFYC